jgi:hypothetical protein
MKIIDQKGKVFGRINIIDLSVIIVLVSFLPLLYLGYRVVALHSQREGARWVPAQIKLLNIDPEFSKVIEIGDVEKNFAGNDIGKLTAISSIKPSKVWVIVDNKTLGTIDDPIKKDMLVDADLLCEKKGGVLYYKSTVVKIGNVITFSTDLYNLSGSIVGLKINDKKTK